MGNGKSDILWRNSSTGQDAMFLMNGLTLTSLTFLNTVQDSSQSACNPNGRSKNTQTKPRRSICVMQSFAAGTPAEHL